MARKKTHKARVKVKESLARRLREVRVELFGKRGGTELARRLGVPARSWNNYETGVTIPGDVLLGFLDLTDANPAWLLRGKGPKYRGARVEAPAPDPVAVELIRRGLELLEQRRGDVAIEGPGDLPGRGPSGNGAPT